jgi:hypothetical protein
MTVILKGRWTAERMNRAAISLVRTLVAPKGNAATLYHQRVPALDRS